MIIQMLYHRKVPLAKSTSNLFIFVHSVVKYVVDTRTLFWNNLDQRKSWHCKHEVWEPVTPLGAPEISTAALSSTHNRGNWGRANDLILVRCMDRRWCPCWPIPQVIQSLCEERINGAASHYHQSSGSVCKSAECTSPAGTPASASACPTNNTNRSRQAAISIQPYSGQVGYVNYIQATQG
jgi:hypothetical protein